MKFHNCINLLYNTSELVEITAAVSPHLEMAEIVNQVVAQSPLSPALMFHSVEGSVFSCVANLFGTTDRISMILSDKDSVNLAQRMKRLDRSITSFAAFMSWLATANEFKPKKVCPAEMICHDDFSALPAIKVWPQDAGTYLSLAVVICQTRKGQQVNCGIYRVQIHGSHQATIRFRPGSDGQKIFAEYQKNNEPMPVAVILGCDPALMFAAVFPLSAGISEFCFASYIQQQPVTYYCSELNSLPIPTASEVVIQGSLDPIRTLAEGPFGNHEGYYSDVEQCPIFNLERIESRINPVIPITMVGTPPTENMVLGSYIAELMIPLVKRQFPQVVEVFMPPETVFHGCAFVQLLVDNQLEAVKQQLQHHPLFTHSKFIVFVDEEIDVHRPHQLFWRLFNHYLHSDKKFNIGTAERIVIDATVNRIVPHSLRFCTETKKNVSDRWHELGLDSINYRTGSRTL